MTPSELAAADRARLEAGWIWFQRNPDHPDAEDFFNERWLPLLRRYEATYGMELEKIAHQQMALTPD